MAIIRNAANTIMKGRVGETTYYVSLGRQVARQRLNNSNYGKDARRTELQQERRVKWANLVNFYKVSKFWMPKAYENLRKGQTDYNRFMQLNVPVSTISLTKQMAESGACIAEAYLITQGSLPSIEISSTETGWTTNIALGDLQIAEQTTVADFSEAVVSNNDSIQEGMQLSFVSYMQTLDAMSVPRLICTLYEVTLDKKNLNMLRSYLPVFCSTSSNGMLATSNEIAVGAFAYILSSQLKGRIEVSTQRLITNNADLMSEYSSASNRTRAIDSYGLDLEVILSPVTTTEQNPTEKPQYIQYISIDTDIYNNGEYIGNSQSLASKTLKIYLAYAVEPTDVKTVKMRTAGTGYITVPTEGVDGNKITVTTTAFSSTKVVTGFEVTMANGDVLTIEFSEQETGTVG